MQKWEYCVLGPVQGIQVTHGAAEPEGFKGVVPSSYGDAALVSCGTMACTAERIKGMWDDPMATLKTVALLGDNGWELVGSGTVEDSESRTAHFLYFKRPMQEQGQES